MKFAMIVSILLLASSSVVSQSAGEPTEWKIVAQVSENRIEFKCVEGCLWTLNAVECANVDECRWTLDQSGVLADATPFDFEAELEKGREGYKRRAEEIQSEHLQSDD